MVGRSVLDMNSAGIDDAGGPAGPRVSAAVLREAVVAATELLGGIRDVLWQVGGAELPELLADLDALAALASGARVSVVAEAVRRGEVERSRQGSLTQWVREWAPSTAALGASAIATTVRTCLDPAREVELAPVLDAACAGELPAAVAVRVLHDYDRLHPDLLEAARPTVLDGLVSVGTAHGVGAVSELRTRIVAEFGAAGALQRSQDRAAHLIELSTPVGDDLDGWRYRLTADAEGKALLESALSALTRPQPAPDGSPDRRPYRRRRGEALLELVRRAVRASGLRGVGQEAAMPEAGASTTRSSASDAPAPDPVVPADDDPTRPAWTASPTSTMYVTVALADLRSGLGAATTLGPAGDPSILGADTARRLACDAGIIPVVLGDRGEILDYGRERRLVPLPMRKLLWLRDRHCTFPGCDLPAWFCDAHHIEHWADGGATTAENTALLCARHHTIVHRDGLTATIDAAGLVSWHEGRVMTRSDPTQAGPVRSDLRNGNRWRPSTPFRSAIGPSKGSHDALEHADREQGGHGEAEDDHGGEQRLGDDRADAAWRSGGPLRCDRPEQSARQPGRPPRRQQPAGPWLGTTTAPQTRDP